jgi:hypothetical protein
MMTKTWILGVVLAAALVIPGVARAHEGHAHKVMGTVSAVTATQIELKTPEGKVVTAKLNPKTTFARGKQKVDAAAVRVGERVVVTVASEKDMIASSVTMAAPTPVVAKK